MSAYVFLTECNDFSDAQILKSFLISQGFHPKVRDEQMRTVAPHFQGLLGKLIIEIPESEFLNASLALEELEQGQPAKQKIKMADLETHEAHLTFTQGLAKKALTNSILGCIFVPLLCNLYSLVLAWRVVREEQPLSATSGKRLILSILFNSLGFYIWLTFGFKYFLRGL